MTLAYRPQSWSGKFKLKHKVGQYHWYERYSHDTHVIRTGARLHYLASHAPYPIMKRWKKVANKFFKRYQKSL